MKQTVYDANYANHILEIKPTFYGAYFVYLDGLFYSSADNLKEAEEEIDELIIENNFKYAFELV